MSDDKRIDSFDDLFEPFDLDAPDDADAPLPPPPATEDVTPTVPCPSCGTANPNYNRHCEACGARLTQGPLPVAPPPMIRATPGSRALAVLGGVIAVVAVGAFLLQIFGGDDGPTATPESTSSTTTSTTVLVLEELRPTSVEASSSLTGFGPENLVDDDPENSWNDRSLRGRDAWLTFRFAQPVQINEIVIQNLTDDVRFRRNYRIKGYEITVDDLEIEISGQLEDSNEPQRIQIASLNTTELTLRVTSTYPAEAVDGQAPFNELALQEVRFFGTTRS